jgi:hypothetical protein
MAKLQAGKTAQLRGIEMAHSHDADLQDADARNDVYVYPADKRPRLANLSATDFNAEFAEYRELLVRIEGEDEVVVAASRGLNQDALIEKFCRRFDLTRNDLKNYVVELGPKAIDESSQALDNIASESDRTAAMQRHAI